jgi:hypothetical protein
MLFLFLSSIAWPYSPIKDIYFSKNIENKTILAEGSSLSYSFFRKEKTTYSLEMSRKAILASSVASLKEIRVIKKDIMPCRPDDHLEIYELSTSQLNNKDRFPETYIYKKDIWGYFDPRPDEVKINSIIVTQQSEFNNFQILTHEVAHHWYSSYCLEEYTKMTSEEFAVKIQFSLENLNVYN